MARKVNLTVVETPLKGATILKSDTAPLIRGDEDTNLSCGSCRIVLGRNVSTETLAAKFVAPVQFLVVCPECGSYNRLPATLGN